MGLCVDERAIPRHELPTDLPPGIPNLIVCSDHDTVPVVMSLYMHSRDQPLPSASEVLLCHEGTTKADIELLLRRAIARDQTRGRFRV